MATTCSAWVARPFTVGHNKGSAPQDDERGTIVPQQDGFISSLLFGLVLLSVAFALSLSEHMSQGQNKPVNQGAVETGLLVLLVPGCFVMARYIFLPNRASAREVFKRREVEYDSAVETRSIVRRYVQTKFPVVGMMVFFLGGLLWDAFVVLAEVDCFSSYSHCHMAYDSLSTIIYRSVKLIFMGITVVFAVIYDQADLLRTLGNRYGMVIIGTGVLALCFESFVAEYQYIGKDPHHHHHPDFWYNCTGGPQKMYHCMNKTSSLFATAETLSKFMGTFNVEFTLIALDWLLHLYVGMKPFHSHSEDALTSSPDDGGSPAQRITSPETVTYAPLTVSEDFEPSEGTPLLHNSSRSQRGFKVPVAAIISVIANLIFVVYGILSFRGKVNGYRLFLLFYWVLMTLCCLVGFWVTKSFQLSNHTRFYSSFEMLVLVCSTGIFCYDTFGYIAIFSLLSGSRSVSDETPPNTNEVIIDLVEKLLNSLQIYLQCSFMMYARQLKAKRPADVHSKILRECLIYLTVTNIMMWAMNSFVIGKTSNAEAVTAYYYGEENWKRIVQFTFPCTNFFRFNSFLFLLKLTLSHSVAE